MFVTFIWLTPFCQIIKILLNYHPYRNTRAYILDPCIQESLIQTFYNSMKRAKSADVRAMSDWCLADEGTLKLSNFHFIWGLKHVKSYFYCLALSIKWMEIHMSNSKHKNQRFTESDHFMWFYQWLKSTIIVKIQLSTF